MNYLSKDQEIFEKVDPVIAEPKKEESSLREMAQQPESIARFHLKPKILKA